MPVTERDLQVIRKIQREIRATLLIPNEVYTVLRILRNIRKPVPVPCTVIFELDGVPHTFPEVIPSLHVQQFAEMVADGFDLTYAADIVGMPLVRPKPKLNEDDRAVVLPVLVNHFKLEWRRRGFG